VVIQFRKRDWNSLVLSHDDERLKLSTYISQAASRFRPKILVLDQFFCFFFFSTLTMASSLTSTWQSGDTLPELPSKLRPFESRGFEDCFSAGNLDKEYNDCVSTDLKSLAATDKKLLEQVSIFEAQKKMNTAMTKFLKEEAERIKKSFDEDKGKSPHEDEDEDEDSEDSDSADEEHDEVQVIRIPLALLEDKAALTQLEVRSFVFKIWARRIQLTRKEDQDKYKSLQDFEHAIYSAQESIKHFKDFISDRPHYSGEELQAIIPYHEDHLEKASNKTLEEKEKASFEMLEEDVAIFCSNKARICALLGLQLDFLDRLDEIPPEDRDHFTLCDWIVTFLSNNHESVDSIDKNCLTKDLLAAIGFDPMSSAVETIMARAGSTQHHIEACEMAELFIRDEFKYNPLLSSMVGRFPFLSDLTNSWFQLPPITTDEEGEETNEDLCHVNIINLVTKESHAITQSMFSDLVSEDEQNVVLFHGTDHQSASDILFRGIDLCAGRQKRDFSCGSGFYLTDNFDEALNWAKNTTVKPAILIFRVNRGEHLDDARKLNLHENGEKWREIVSSFRSGKRTAKTRKSLSEYELIEGSAATITRNESGELVIEPKRSSNQMCLISEDFADTFRETLHSVMFLDIC